MSLFNNIKEFLSDKNISFKLNPQESEMELSMEDRTNQTRSAVAYKNGETSVDFSKVASGGKPSVDSGAKSPIDPTDDSEYEKKSG